MLWWYVSAAGLGLMFGLRFRVPAVIAASAVLVVTGVAAGPLLGWSLGSALVAAFGAAFVLQCGYFAGLLLMCAFTRIGSWSDIGERLIYSYRARARGGLTRP